MEVLQNHVTTQRFELCFDGFSQIQSYLTQVLALELSW
jgi:hypothetical protein